MQERNRYQNLEVLLIKKTLPKIKYTIVLKSSLFILNWY